MARVMLALSLLLSVFVHAAEPDLLEPEKAFEFSARLIDAGQVEVRYGIAPGYYLYREKFKFSAVPATVTVDAAQLPPGKVKKDEFFGEVQIYRGEQRFVLPVKGLTGDAPRFTLNVVSQGCADIGVCYPPQEQKAELTLAAFSPAGAAKPGTPYLAAAPATRTPGGQSEDALIAGLFKGGFWVLIASFFGFGLLLALTPCVFPMIPILSGILVPHGENLTHLRGFVLSLVYVIGMALTYALAGIAAGILGTALSAALQNAWVLSAFAAIFVVLALSMFGFYELQLPGALQSKLASTSNKLHGGHFASVFVMGVLSALIVGPCVAAPLAGALLYISQSGDGVLGGVALFSMALGMGVPLLVVGASAGTLLPKAGSWMETVKRFFGVVLLGVAIYLVSPLLPAVVHMLAWAALLIVSAIYLHALDPLPVNAPGARKLFKGIGVIGLLAGAALLIGALSGGRDVLQPLAGLRGAGTAVENAPAFKRIDSSAQLDDAIRAAAGKPVMLDFYADWCVSCKEMERYTFVDEAVKTRLANVVALQADVTQNRDEHKALLKRFNLFGPPGIVFFDRQGKLIEDLRVVGFQPANNFAATLDLALR
ncbi:MAG: thiol:disulfide interchange protein [Betaproteobacteria bacterium]|nr:thiol:disulfide interchange protein [Betaproteobacteria bacterium]